MLRFLDGNSALPSECTGSPFVDKDHDHKTIDHNKIITISCRNFSLKVQSTNKTELLIMKNLRKV